ncbi:MAG: CBS domain-containing protein, partial [Acidobacteriota bacterium]
NTSSKARKCNVRSRLMNERIWRNIMGRRINDFMTKDPACCTPDTSLQDVARMMIEHDCGCIPVVENGIPIGTVTDRDITVRLVAAGKNPVHLTAKDCMTEACVTVKENAALNEAMNLMEENRIRRILVVDPSGTCCGIVAQADIARHADKKETGEVVQQVSQPV